MIDDVSVDTSDCTDFYSHENDDDDDAQRRLLTQFLSPLLPLPLPPAPSSGPHPLSIFRLG